MAERTAILAGQIQFRKTYQKGSQQEHNANRSKSDTQLRVKNLMKPYLIPHHIPISPMYGSPRSLPTSCHECSIITNLYSCIVVLIFQFVDKNRLIKSSSYLAMVWKPEHQYLLCKLHYIDTHIQTPSQPTSKNLCLFGFEVFPMKRVIFFCFFSRYQSLMMQDKRNKRQTQYCSKIQRTRYKGKTV